MKNVFKVNYVTLAATLIMSSAYANGRATANEKASAPKGGVEYSACENRHCENRWMISGDLLYWTACEGGFGCDFGTTTITTTVSNGQVVTDIREKDKDIDFDWNLGFRVGTGYEFASCWDLDAYWTYFHANGRGHDGDNRARWKLRFSEVDLLTGYRFKYKSCFGLRPFGGLRYANISQNISTHLESAIIVAATNSSSLAISTKRNNEWFWGVGPLFGFEGDYYFGAGFSCYGNLAGNFLYGRFKNKFNEKDVFTAAVSRCHSKSENCTILTGFDAGLGFRYKVNCLTLQLGWEHHTYFDYNQLGCSGDLNLYGLNASIILRF